MFRRSKPHAETMMVRTARTRAGPAFLEKNSRGLRSQSTLQSMLSAEGGLWI